MWLSVNLLRQMGLLGYIPHLMESDSPQAEPIHPFGIGRNGEEQIEAEIGAAADAAGRAMCTEWAVQQAEDDGFEWFCPVPPNVASGAVDWRPQAEVIGPIRTGRRRGMPIFREMRTATIEHYSKNRLWRKFRFIANDYKNVD